MSDPYAALPEVLKSLPNWVTWQLEKTKDGKDTKIPYKLDGYHASSTNPATWTDFKNVQHIKTIKTGGIGFVFDGGGIVGIDLDHCLKEDGTVDPKYSQILERLKSYTEISPSGTGLHLYVKCSEHPFYWRSPPTKDYPEGKEHFGKKKGDFEIYSKERYFTVTGCRWLDSPLEIREYPVQLIRELCDPFLNNDKDDDKPQNKPQPRNTTQDTKAPVTDQQVIRTATAAPNGHKFSRLMEGDVSGYPSSSEADAALAAMLAFWTQKNAGQVESIMRSSGLARDKWSRDDYLPRTIDNAINVTTGVFTGEYLTEDAPPVQVADVEKEIANAEKLCYNALPPLPEINHPLFTRWIVLGKELMFSHPAYHFGNLLAIASMALGRRVGIAISTAMVYTNLYVMLIGTTTVSGKSFSASSAIKNFGSAVLTTAPPVNPSDNTILQEGTIGTSAMIQGLEEHSGMFWYYDEADQFFKESNQRGWNADMLPNLCKVYDGSAVSHKYSSRNKKTDKSEYYSDNHFVSLLFTMTIRQLQDAANIGTMSSGFFPRWVWFIEDGGERKANVSPTADKLQEIKEIAEKIKTVSRKIKLLQPDDIRFRVNADIENWAIEASKKHPTDDNYQASVGRGMIHAYKIAVILAMFDPKFHGLVFDKPHYPVVVDIPDEWAKAAIRIENDYLLPRMMRVLEFSNRVDATNKQQMILEALKEMRGSAQHRALLRKTRLESVEFSRAVATLIESGDIKAAVAGKSKLYYLTGED